MADTIGRPGPDRKSRDATPPIAAPSWVAATRTPVPSALGVPRRPIQSSAIARAAKAIAAETNRTMVATVGAAERDEQRAQCSGDRQDCQGAAAGEFASGKDQERQRAGDQRHDDPIVAEQVAVEGAECRRAENDAARNRGRHDQ